LLERKGVTTAGAASRLSADAPVHFRVLGPDAGGVSPADLRRLFRGQRLTSARRNGLAHGGRILALCGPRVVGLAAFERTERELRVGEMGIDTDSTCPTWEIADGLLGALELACVAGSVARLVLLPRAGALDEVLRQRGYTAVAQVAAGTWFEKHFD
jgi:hypothetical protein